MRTKTFCLAVIWLRGLTNHCLSVELRPSRIRLADGEPTRLASRICAWHSMASGEMPTLIAIWLIVAAQIGSPISAHAQARNNDDASESENWAMFHLEELVKQRAESGRPYLRFLDRASMSMGLYELKSGAQDGQSPHRLDEVYYIVKGRAILKPGSEEIPVQPGSVVYIRAEVEHRFHSISEDLQALVIFSKTKFDGTDPAHLAFEMKGIQSQRKPGENVWNRFLNASTMAFGLYMLPQQLGGDRTLTHRVDEVNIVISGTAKFKMGEDEIDVKPGSIVWVKEGVGHSFHNLTDDFDVLILFEKRKKSDN